VKLTSRFRTASDARKVKDGGFSFIELLAYMAIAALLILAAIPQFNQYRTKAVISNMQSDARNIATTIEAQYTTDLAYPATVTTVAQVVKIGATDTQKISDAGTLVGYSRTGSGATEGFQLTLTNSKAPLKQVQYKSTEGGLQKVVTVAGEDF
jgi:Tfp pilus assembly protein PilE